MAVKWYEKAAAGGDEQAAKNLALRKESSMGVD
jgi:TPR repeat protein